MIPPILFLAVLLAITSGALIFRLARGKLRSSRLRQLAAQWQMHYTAGDRFRLADRIAGRLAVPGAASVRVQDVIYGTEGDCYRYLFTAFYTTGVLRRKLDERCVCTITERRQRADSRNRDLGILRTAPKSLGLIEQYAELRRDL